MEENKKPQNPNAFPTPMDTVGMFNETGHQIGCQDGMTLRDYFATASIQGILSAQTAMRSNGAQNNHFGDQIESICEEAYQIADAMLKQREL